MFGVFQIFLVFEIKYTFGCIVCVQYFFSGIFKRLLGLFHWVFGLSFVFFGILDLLGVWVFWEFWVF